MDQMDVYARNFYENMANMYASVTLKPLALILTLTMGVLVLAMPKRKAVLPILIVTLFITMLQRLVIASIDLSMVRLMILFGWARVILRREAATPRRSHLDALFVVFGLTQVICHFLQSKSFSALVTALGGCFDMLGLYFLFRILIKDFDHAEFAIRVFAVLIVPVALAMMVEQLTGRNIFHVFGGVSELSQVREGRIRSQASFSHPILAGTFAATLIPLFIAMWKRNSLSKRFAVIGILAALVMIYACASSGPIFSLLAGLCVVCMWPLAPHMRKIRWIILLMLGGLQLMMKSPIYSLIARVPMMSGSTGGYRYMLLDAFFRHFKDWALVGIPSTWYWGEGLVDVTNHYIRIAVDGGLFSLLLFLTAIGFEFRQLGIGLRVLREKKAEADWFFMWCLGAALFSHLVSFISVSYFDQVIVPYYMVLAMIPALSHSADLQPAGVSAELRESMSLS